MAPRCLCLASSSSHVASLSDALFFSFGLSAQPVLLRKDRGGVEDHPDGRRERHLLLSQPGNTPRPHTAGSHLIRWLYERPLLWRRTFLVHQLAMDRALENNLFGSGFRPTLSIYVRPKLFYELSKKKLIKKKNYANYIYVLVQHLFILYKDERIFSFLN